MILLCVLILILYCIPLRYLILIWGVVRFTRTLRVGDIEPNNELLDYLSRLPSDKELVSYPLFIHSINHSFIHSFSIAPLQAHYYSEALPTQRGCCVGVSRRSATISMPQSGECLFL